MCRKYRLTRSLQAAIWRIEVDPSKYRTKIWEAGFEFMGKIEDDGVKFMFSTLEFVKFPHNAVVLKR